MFFIQYILVLVPSQIFPTSLPTQLYTSFFSVFTKQTGKLKNKTLLKECVWALTMRGQLGSRLNPQKTKQNKTQKTKKPKTKKTKNLCLWLASYTFKNLPKASHTDLETTLAFYRAWLAPCSGITWEEHWFPADTGQVNYADTAAVPAIHGDVRDSLWRWT